MAAVGPQRGLRGHPNLSPSGYYAWLSRPPSKRSERDAELIVKIQAVFDDNRQVHGRPRIFADLKEQGESVGEKRVGRLMKQEEIQGASRRKRGPKTTKRNKDARPAPDLVERDFAADSPDQLWVADITYIPTRAGFLYLAIVLDAWSRRIVGWAMATHLRTELVLEALNLATWQRRPKPVVAVFDFMIAVAEDGRGHPILVDVQADSEVHGPWHGAGLLRLRPASRMWLWCCLSQRR